MAGRGVPGALTALAAGLMVAGCAGSPVHRVAPDSPAVVRYKTAFAADRERLDAALADLLRCQQGVDCWDAANRVEVLTTGLGDLYYFESPERVLTPQPVPACLRPADRHVGAAMAALRPAALRYFGSTTSQQALPSPADLQLVRGYAATARSELATAALLLAAAHC